MRTCVRFWGLVDRDVYEKQHALYYITNASEQESVDANLIMLNDLMQYC